MPRIGFGEDYNLGGEIVGGGETPGLFSTYYQTQSKRRPYGPQGNPVLDRQAQISNQRDLNDRAYLQQLYKDLQAQAEGGITPQQRQQQEGFRQAAMNQQQLAMSQPGGARARSAAMGGLTQQAGIQAMDNSQQAQMLKAQDQISAQNQMQQVAAMQRAQDLQSQGITAEDAYRQAQLELRGRGLNIQHQLGYYGLEGDALRQNEQSFLDAYRRTISHQKRKRANEDAWLGRSLQGAGALAGKGA